MITPPQHRRWRWPWAQRASATTALEVAAVSGAQAVWTPERFDKLIEEGYKHAVWAFACIRWLTQSAKPVRWLVYLGEDEAPATHPWLTLMNHPNDEQGPGAFIEAAYGFWLASGNTYLERVGTEGAPPAELWVKRPDRIKVIPDAENRVRGYLYELAGKSYTFDRWQMRHLKTWNPTNDWYGLSTLRAAARGIDIFNAGQAHNLALLQNGARPTGAFKRNESLSDAQFRRIREQMREIIAYRDRGAPLILEGGTEWVEMGLSPKDLDWLEGQKDAARQIHAAFGVNPVITGLGEGTFENQKQALRSMMVNSVLPFLDYFTSELNDWLSPVFRGARLDFDRDAFPTMSEDQESLWRRAESGWRSGLLTRNEARSMVAWDEIDPARGDIFVNEQYASLTGGIRNPQQLPAETEPTLAEDDEQALAYAPTYRKGLGLSTDEQRAAYHEARIKQQDDLIPLMADYVEAVFKGERAGLQAAIKAAGSNPDLGIIAALVVGDEERWRDMEAEWLALAVAGAETILDRFQVKSAREHRRLIRAAPTFSADYLVQLFGIYFQETIDFVQQHTLQLVGEITQTTLEAVTKTITQGAQQGLSIPEIAEELDKLYLEHIIPNRTTVIARTETIRATNAGGQAAAKGTGLTLTKRWLATLTDSRTRPAHLEANGQTVPIDAAYLVDGESLEYPGDPSGSPENTIQCRCSEAYAEVDPGA